MSDAPYADKLEIRELIENWAIWRDSGDWHRFATVWHDDGWMSATWFQGPATDFIRVSQAGGSRGLRILHSLGGSNIEVAGTRAILQTKMTISQRASVHGSWCDVVCTGRFDFLEKRAGRWGMVRRQAARRPGGKPDGSVCLRICVQADSRLRRIFGVARLPRLPDLGRTSRRRPCTRDHERWSRRRGLSAPSSQPA